MGVAVGSGVGVAVGVTVGIGVGVGGGGAVEQAAATRAEPRANMVRSFGMSLIGRSYWVVELHPCGDRLG